VRIAVISDTRYPTSRDYPGHGLGKANLMIAEGLAARGHEVALFGGPGSDFEHGETFTGESEMTLGRKAALWCGDAAIDGGHEHWYQRVAPGEPVLNLSHDRERHPGGHAVYPSKAHSAFWGGGGTIIPYGIEVGDWERQTKIDYLLWLGAVDIPHKGAAEAMRVARAAGKMLVLAGTGKAMVPGFIGPVSGEGKWKLLAGARALLATGQIESAGLVALEAASVGTPTLCFDLGGLPEYVADGVSGFICQDEAGMAAAIGRLDDLPGPEACKAWVQAERSADRMIDQWEAAVRAVSGQQSAVSIMAAR